ncbi:amiloride-sensitive sodium channel domain-containing protein [Ditylenchus destructor]|uniref:Amiloride-sensitive sodium channel domain-containing protein n=1 Tax=Ditylenchus destructor TaxID=166010 RepID=A0AAD4ND20_9BILA|nr:amiloride-sensitive sodium channel domain-containing protein [Ditylenchus destructor]
MSESSSTEVEAADPNFIAGCSLQEPLLLNNYYPTVFRGYSSDDTSWRQHKQKHAITAQSHGSNKSHCCCARRDDWPKYSAEGYTDNVTENTRYENPNRVPDPTNTNFAFFDALEQFPRRFHLRHSITDNFVHSKSRRNSYTDFLATHPQIDGNPTFGEREYRRDKKLTKLRRAYNRRKRKLNSLSNSSSDSDSSEMAYPSNDENEKRSCKDAFFGKQMRKWGFWFIVAFLAALTIKDVIALFIEYSENPKQSDMNIRFNESMTMPNITFCMSRSQAWSHFRLNTSETPEQWDEEIQDQLMNMTDHASFLSTPWDWRMVMETYNLISALTSMERETTLEGSANTIQKFGTQERFETMRKNLKMWIDVLNDRGVNFEEFVQKVGKETLRRSMQRFQRTSYKDDEVIKTQMKITWISQMQLCFQPMFDQDNFKAIEDQGNFFTMVLSHNAEKLDGMQVECMSIDFHGRPSSLSRFSGHKGQAKDGFNDELCMGMVHETTVEVKARYKMLPNDEEGTACKDHEDGEDNEFDCHARCRMEFIKELCKCTAPTLSYLVSEDELKAAPLCEYSNCKIDVQMANYTDNGCTKKCARDCDQIRFEIDHERKGKSVRPDLTTIYLLWGSFEYLTLEQDWVWSLSSFIAALGGSIGMWLGLSILSLIQGTTYMYNVVHDNVIKKKTRQVSNATSTGYQGKMSTVNSHKTEKAADDGIAVPAKNPFSSPFKGNKLSTSQSPDGPPP